MVDKYQEALDYFVETVKESLGRLSIFGKVNHKVLQELIDKDTPKKVYWNYNEVWRLVNWYCPNCYENYKTSYKPKHCQCCGQALDWSEEDGK